MYSPFIGRFMERDPIESDLNLYRYCGGNPVVYVDPAGLRLIDLDVQANDAAKGDRWKEKDEESFRVSRQRAQDMIAKLERMSDARFEEIRKKGTVEFNGDKFGGNRGEYIAKLRRELTSRLVGQYRSGYAELKSKLKEVVAYNNEPYDITAVELHGGSILSRVGIAGDDEDTNFKVQYSFAVLANCDGSTTWAIVSLGGDAKKTATIREMDKQWDYDPVSRSAPTNPSEGARTWEQDWSRYFDNVPRKTRNGSVFAYTGEMGIKAP